MIHVMEDELQQCNVRGGEGGVRDELERCEG